MSNKANKQQISEPKTKKKESAWEFTRSMIVLVGIVILVKYFVCDIFFIPTGSMEPTLHGHKDSGDRIFCTKLNYLWRNPQRWEIFVFKFPYEQTPQGDSSSYKGEYFIKRCVGLPGESIALAGGDVFIVSPDAQNLSPENAKREVKSDKIQEKIWIPVYSENFSNIDLEELKYYWNIESSKDTKINIENKELEISSNDNETTTLTFKPHTRFESLPGIPDRYVRRQVVEFACPVIGCEGEVRKTISSPKITARCPKCGEYLQESDVVRYDFRTGYPVNYQATFEKVSEVADPQYRGEWWHFVPDLSFTCQAELANKSSSIRCNILSDATEYSAIFTTDKVTVLLNNKVLKNVSISFKPAEKTELRFYHLDGQIRGYIGSKEVFDITTDSQTLNSSVKNPSKTNISLDIKGSAKLSNIAITRDIYYYNYRDSKNFFRLPNDGYMALGDNCPSSNDSRFWGPVPQKNLTGTAQFVWWPLHAIKNLR